MWSRGVSFAFCIVHTYCQGLHPCHIYCLNHLTFLKRNVYSVDVQQPFQLVLNSFMDMGKIKFLLKLVNCYTRKMTSFGYLFEHLIGKETNFVYLYKKLLLKRDTLLVSIARETSLAESANFSSRKRQTLFNSRKIYSGILKKRDKLCLPLEDLLEKIDKLGYL